ncbi:MAG TPA: fasciclin domain-containing protein [Prolixibacteraceae bacterium]|nr:fasciclin domain-containing protein [Prolixibacteraceae bacterium]
MKYYIGILLLAIILSIFGCKENWEDHYANQDETVNTNVWDEIKNRSDLSKFTELMVKYKYDTLFKSSDNIYTLFVPNNAAYDKYVGSQVNDTTILNYHISRHLILPVGIVGKRKLQTRDDKYSTFENINGESFYDGIPISYESQLYINGKFFIIDEVAHPRLNLYEYFSIHNPYLKNYIDTKDSIILNKEKSRPIGFDANGNTVYDTIATKLNLIDSLYFPVSKEFRARTATFAFPGTEKYNSALTAMAQKLGGSYVDYNDIPMKWQEGILIPHLLKHGTFLNMLEVSEFKSIDDLSYKKKYNMVNIKGDSVVVDYIPTDKYLSSNGIAYDYTNFVIPDSLYAGTEKFQGEWLARPTGANKFAWRTNVSVENTTSFEVKNTLIKGQSNDSVLNVNFTKGYTGTFKLQFYTQNLFPRKYRMIVYTHMDVGGIYDIYVNDVLVRTFDYTDYTKMKGLIKSVTGANFIPTGRNNRFDCYINNITDYNKAKIRFEYKGPGNAPGNGLVIDVIEFLPVIE